MYIKLILCKTQDDTSVLAIGPAFNTDLIKDKEILISDFTGNVKKRVTIIQAIDIDDNSPGCRFLLESHTMTWEDLFEVTHVIDYKEVQSTLNR